jgi:predicted Zn-dependent peptidase
MRVSLRWFAALGLVGALGLAAAPVKKIQFTDTKLKNGLRVIISEDHSAPVFAVAVNYDVGSRDERKGRTGFAHLFEHMMFEGSANVGDGEHFQLVFSNGGSMNGTTNQERTLYYEVLPANQLDLALFLEADRMRSLDITKENLDNQRHAVQEERRLRVDNQAYGKTFEVLGELAYDNFAYAHSVIGSMADLDAATVDDVAAFFKMYYAPNNAVLSIVGDVDTKATLEKVRKYFEPIPSQPAPPAPDVAEPPQKEERRATLEDALARLPRIDMVYKIPPSSSPDYYPLSVLGTILSGGRSSRFNEMIVRQKQLATVVNAFAGESRGPGLFSVIGVVAPGKTAADLEAAIDAEIERLKAGPIEDWEIEKARTSARNQLVAGLGSSLNRAVTLGEDALFYNDPNRINTRADSIAKVTQADVQRVARQYLVKTGRTVVTTTPKAAPAKGGQQ